MKLLFSERLRDLRIEKDMKQIQLAEKLHTTQRKVSYWETGKTEPDLASLWEIAELFGVSVDYLIGKIDY